MMEPTRRHNNTTRVYFPCSEFCKNLRGDQHLCLAVGLFVLHTGLSELLTGQTLGKKALGCRVVAEDGSDPDLWQVLARNAVKGLEVLAWPLLLFVLLNPARQRLGDLVARTLVVRPAPPSTGNPPPQE